MHGEYKVPGGKLVVVDLEATNGRLHEVELSGDFLPRPEGASGGRPHDIGTYLPADIPPCGGQR